MDGALCGGVLGTKDTGVCFEIRLAKVDTGTCSTAVPEKSFRPHPGPPLPPARDLTSRA